jgi:hypothetical protein
MNITLVSRLGTLVEIESKDDVDVYVDGQRKMILKTMGPSEIKDENTLVRTKIMRYDCD